MKTLLALTLAALLTACGGGGCDAGRPAFESAEDECEARAEPAQPPASAPGG